MAVRPGPDGEASNPYAIDKPSMPSTPPPPPPPPEPTPVEAAKFQKKTGEAYQPLNPLQGLIAPDGGNLKPTAPIPGLLGEDGDDSWMRGKARFEARISQPPSYAKPNTLDWYKWVLSLPQDKNDAEYSAELAAKQVEAADTLRTAGIDNPYLWLRTGKTNTDAAEQGKTNIADRKEQGGLHAQNAAQRYSGVHVVDSTGADVDPTASLRSTLASPTSAASAYVDSQAAGGASPSPSPSATGGKAGGKAAGLARDPSAPIIGDPVDPKALMKAGNVVYVGSRKMMTPYGVEVDRAEFMAVDDAKSLSAGWDPDQVAAFQKATKNKITGYMDTPSQKDWEDLVGRANWYTTHGHPTNPMDLLQAQAAMNSRSSSSGGSGGSGGGGGGGGGGGAGGSGVLVPAGQARMYLSQYMRQYVGRDANDAEAAAFAQAINAAATDPNFNAQAFATQWISTHNGGEGGAYQSATSYYQAAMQAIQGGM